MLILERHTRALCANVFLPDGRLSFYGLHSGIEVWELSTSKKSVTWAPDGWFVTQVAVDDINHRLFALTLTDELADWNRFWVIDTRTGRADAIPTQNGVFARVHCAPKTGRVVCGSIGPWAELYGRQPPENMPLLVCWDTSGAAPFEVTWTLPNEPADVFVADLEFASDGERLVTLETSGIQPSRETVIRVRNAATGERLTEQLLPTPSASQVIVSPVANAVVLLSKNRLYVWYFDPLRDLQLISSGTKKHFTAVAFHPSGRYLAATSNDATVKLYDTSTWEVARTFTWDIGRMRSIAFSPDGTLAAAGSDTGKVVVWDVDV